MVGRVRIVCDDASHTPKVAYVDWLEFRNAGSGLAFLVGGRERLISDVPVDVGELFGTLSGPPIRPPSDLDRARARYSPECKLCGLRVEMRAETAGPIALALISNGVPQISLRGLAGIVSQ